MLRENCELLVIKVLVSFKIAETRTLGIGIFDGKVAKRGGKDTVGMWTQMCVLESFDSMGYSVWRTAPGWGGGQRMRERRGQNRVASFHTQLRYTS